MLDQLYLFIFCCQQHNFTDQVYYKERNFTFAYVFQGPQSKASSADACLMGSAGKGQGAYVFLHISSVFF